MMNKDFVSTVTMKLAELHSLDVFYTPLEARFDRLTRLLRLVTGMPVAAVSLANREKFWFKSVDGWDVDELPATHCLDSFTLETGTETIIPDTSADERVRHHPLVMGSPQFRFYAGIPLLDTQRMPVGVVSMCNTRPHALTEAQLQSFRDISIIAQKELLTTELRDAQVSLLRKLNVARRKASLDDVTRIWARSAGTDLLTEMLKEAERNSVAVAVCVADIDRFKEINDTGGHQCGDRVLRHVARRIVSSLRSEDVVCRMGGDEFLFAVYGVDRVQLEQLLMRIGATVRALTVRTRDSVLKTSISIGATFTESAQVADLDLLIDQADRALYRAKAEGRDGFQIFRKPTEHKSFVAAMLAKESSARR